MARFPTCPGSPESGVASGALLELVLANAFDEVAGYPDRRDTDTPQHTPWQRRFDKRPRLGVKIGLPPRRSQPRFPRVALRPWPQRSAPRAFWQPSLVWVELVLSPR